jgi:hypothetical protein
MEPSASSSKAFISTLDESIPVGFFSTIEEVVLS